jgi:hypothetical protein
MSQNTHGKNHNLAKNTHGKKHTGQKSLPVQNHNKNLNFFS